jgi:carbamoyltransferase
MSRSDEPVMDGEPILGVWGYSSDVPNVLHHDSGAAVVAGGKVLAAVNEERITRKKNEGRWPSASIAMVLELSGLAPRDITRIAMAGLPPLKRGALMVSELLKLFRETGIVLPNRWLYAALTAKKIRRHGPSGFDAPITFVAHHDGHAASAALTSPFDECAVVTLDGIGDSAHCGGVFSWKEGRLARLRSLSGYASPGILYSYVTKAFGFRPARHEGKITGLAGHGDPAVLIDEFRKRLEYRDRKLVSKFIPRLFENRVDADWSTRWIDDLLDEHSREDIAAALQRHTEDLAVAIARDALADTGAKNIALAGGVFANVRVNQRIREITPGNIWIHPHMGDGGLAAGSALFAGNIRSAFADAYLGDEPGSLEALRLEAKGLPVRKPARIAEAVATAVANGLIVGRCAGRMEYGPRALGNRTIFVTAKDPAINDSLNKRLRRTEFMPFAPIMTRAAARTYLVNWSEADRAAEFMTVTYQVTEACRRDAPAIVHVDGTARPQVVPSGGFLHDLLEAYGRLTGSEIMINTSFNMHEEPIVHTASDALRSYEHGAVDLLAFDEHLVGMPDALERCE